MNTSLNLRDFSISPTPATRASRFAPRRFAPCSSVRPGDGAFKEGAYSLPGVLIIPHTWRTDCGLGHASGSHSGSECPKGCKSRIQVNG